MAGWEVEGEDGGKGRLIGVVWRDCGGLGEGWDGMEVVERGLGIYELD